MNSASSSNSRLLVAAVVVVAAAAGGFVAYRAYEGTADTEALKPTPIKPASRAVDNAVPASAPIPPAESKRKIPDTLPEVTLQDREGKPTALATFGGRPLMINFWATWCAPCRREIPLLNRLQRERRPQNMQIVGIAVDFREDVLKFVDKVPLEYALLIGEEDGLAAADAFGMGLALPFSVFVDSRNRILAVKVGELHEDEANFAFDRLRDMDRGILTREQAQELVREAFREMAAERAREEHAADHAAGE